MTCQDARTLLHAFFDGELGPADRTAVDAHIQTCASCTASLAELQSLRDTMRAEGTYHHAPPGLAEQVRSALRASQRIEGKPVRVEWRMWSAIAAALVLVAGFLLTRSNRERELIADELFSAHTRALMGREIDVASSDRHTVKPWFNGKLPFSPPVADLASDGFPLEGGRLDFAGGRTVAALVYRRNLHRIDVFVWTADGAQPPAQMDRNGFHEISWTKDGFAFTAISDLNVAELCSFTRLLQTRD